MRSKKRHGKAAIRKNDNPLPQDWLEEFLGKGDFDDSFQKLEGVKHFHAETMRGRIRSLQLRFAEAWEHFDQAYERSLKAHEDIPNLVRQFILNIYCFEHALLEKPLSPSERDTKIPELWIPELPEIVLDEYPEVKLVINLRRASEGFLRLHLGDYQAAADVFQGLIEKNPRARPDTLMMNYLGLAACQHNQGLDELARWNLENASLAIQAGGETINRARWAAVLHAFYTFLGDEEEANGWKAFLERLPCPQATRDAFLKRAKLILDRCSEQSKMLLI